MVNVIVTPPVYAAQREQIRRDARALIVIGILERADGATNVMPDDSSVSRFSAHLGVAISGDPMPTDDSLQQLKRRNV